MEYLAILGRQPEISIAEIEAQCLAGPAVATSSALPGSQAAPYFEFTSSSELKIDHFGGMLKLAVKLEKRPLEFLQELPEGKITIGVSDYSKNASMILTSIYSPTSLLVKQ